MCKYLRLIEMSAMQIIRVSVVFSLFARRNNFDVHISLGVFSSACQMGWNNLDVRMFPRVSACACGGADGKVSPWRTRVRPDALSRTHLSNCCHEASGIIHDLQLHEKACAARMPRICSAGLS